MLLVTSLTIGAMVILTLFMVGLCRSAANGDEEVRARAFADAAPEPRTLTVRTREAPCDSRAHGRPRAPLARD